ncbi:MAG: CapA family protein [bacterium]|nr:CapA family protein [bacterium]
MRIAARVLDAGSVEFALQQRREGTWGIRHLPARRFIPADATPGRWLTSSPLPIAGLQVRIAVRKLEGGSIELALQQQREGTWGTRQLPTRRLIPADAVPGRWLTSSPLTPAGPSAVPAPPEWTLLAGGDVQMDRTEPAGIDPFEGIEPPLASGDLAVVNVEMAISDRGAPIGKKFTFRAPSSAAKRIGDAGIDVANLANNHAKDYGPVALTDTIASLEAAGVVALGAGANDTEAFRHRLLEVHGAVTVAFVGVSRIVPRSFPAGADSPGIATDTEPERVLASVRTADAEADVVIANVHWGIEVATCPSAEQRAFAQELFDAGADAVIGHHPHVLQAIEFDDGKLAAYSLGNFVWHPRMGITGETGVLQIDFAGDRIVGWEFHPHLLDENGAPRPAGAGWRLDRLNDLIEGDCERYEGTSPYDLRPPRGTSVRGDTSTSAAQQDAGMRRFSAQQFKELLDAVRLPNLMDIADAPTITGDVQTDERIGEVAEGRGYRLQPAVASLDELVSVEQKLLQPEAARAYGALSAAAREAGHQLILRSAYRGFDVQRFLLFRHLKEPFTSERIRRALRVVAPPGYSRHQTGYAVDLETPGYGINDFKHSDAYAWLAADNFLAAKRHGFIPSYPAGVENQGPDPEPWEFFYVGVDNLLAPPPPSDP